MKILVVALAFTLHGCVFAFSIAPPAWENTLVQQEDQNQPLADASKGSSEIILDFPIGRDPTSLSGVISSVRYGPFELPAGGMVNELLFNVKKPCADCFIVAVQSRIEDTYRTELVTDSGFWLHHVIFFNKARPDLTCPAGAGERFYGGGNTKATRRWNLNGRWGYRARESDVWDLVVDLMNEGVANVEAVVRVDFEWVSASSEEGRHYREVRPIWITLDHFCDGIGVPVPSVTKPFRIRTPSWLSSVEGPILDVAAHVHDGGLDMSTYLNGHEICRSGQLYGQNQEPHIVGQGACKNVGRLKRGDVLLGEVRYDPRKHALVMHDGKPDKIMGSDGLYVGIE